MFGRKSVEPNLPTALTERNRSLKHLFTVKSLAMKQKPKKVKDIKKVDEKEMLKNKEDIDSMVKTVQDKYMKVTLSDVSRKGVGKKCVGMKANVVEKVTGMVGSDKIEKEMVENPGLKAMGKKKDNENNEVDKDNEKLDENGYKTIMRPSVSSFYKGN